MDRLSCDPGFLCASSDGEIDLSTGRLWPLIWSDNRRMALTKLANQSGGGTLGVRWGVFPFPSSHTPLPVFFFSLAAGPPSISWPSLSDARGKIKDVFSNCTLPKGCLAQIWFAPYIDFPPLPSQWILMLSVVYFCAMQACRETLGCCVSKCTVLHKVRVRGHDWETTLFNYFFLALFHSSPKMQPPQRHVPSWMSGHGWLKHHTKTFFFLDELEKFTSRGFIVSLTAF